MLSSISNKGDPKDRTYVWNVGHILDCEIENDSDAARAGSSSIKDGALRILGPSPICKNALGTVANLISLIPIALPLFRWLAVLLRVDA